MANIKSNQLKTVVYPDEFSEEQKLDFDNLYAQAKILHAETERDCPYIIYLAIVCHIRAKAGFTESFTDEEFNKIKADYELKTKLFACDVEPDHYIYDKENNPIYFPSTVNISDGTSNLVIKNNPEENLSNTIVEAKE